MNLQVSPAFAGYTVFEYLGVLEPLWPRRVLDDLFARGRVRSAGRPVSPRRPVGSLGDLELVGSTDELPRIWAPGTPCGVDVIAEDAHVTVVSKPSGVPVVPDRDGGRESCLGFLLNREIALRVEKPLERFERPRVVHRIDRLTSGLVIFARTPSAERELAAALEGRRVRKDYRAIVLGDVRAARLTVDAPIEPGRKARMRAGAKGRDALTVFEVLERFGEHTLVRASPRSGRTHQIRVHALAAGWPLVEDPLYRPGEFAARSPPPGIERLALHAFAYELPRSWPGRRRFQCELADDFAAALEGLRGS